MLPLNTLFALAAVGPAVVSAAPRGSWWVDHHFQGDRNNFASNDGQCGECDSPALPLYFFFPLTDVLFSQLNRDKLVLE